MKKMHKYTLVLSSAILGIACSMGSSLITASAANTVAATSDLFISEKVIAQTAYMPQESSYEGTGILLQTETRNAEIMMRDVFSGEFSLLCEPILYKGLSTLKAMTITFTDVRTEQTFDLNVTFGNTAQLSVSMNEWEAGIVYVNDKMFTQTSIANESGVYTEYSSFLMPISLNPETMCVSVGTGANKLLVWDLCQPENDGRYVGETLEPFSTYTVSYTLTDFLGTSSGLVLYSLNGYSLNEVILSETGAGAPTIGVNVSEKGLIGKKYTLPKACASDLKDGLIKDVTMELFSPDGNAIVVKDNAFVPKMAGKYIAKYTATNSFGKIAKIERVIEVLSAMPSYLYEFTETDEIVQTARVDETLRIPQLNMSGGLLIRGNETAKVTVKRNGIAQVWATKRISGFSYTLQQAGEYTIIYHLPNEELIYNVQVSPRTENVHFEYEFFKAYSIGEYVDLSMGKLYVDKQTQPFDVIVQYPNGNKYKNQQFVLNEVGRYTVTVICKSDNTKQATYSFNVISRIQDLFAENENVEVSYGKSTVTQRSGIRLKGKTDGAVVTYKNTIDLSRYVNQSTECDGLSVFGETKLAVANNATPLIELTVDPYSYGLKSTKKIYVELTDVYDKNNKITISLDWCNSNTWTYVRAKATGQALAGLDYAHNGVYTLKTDNYGTGAWHTFSGKTNGAYSAKDSRVALYYDVEEKQLLLGSSGYSDEHKCRLVADFDNPQLCSGNAWNGFSSNEVELSVRFSQMDSATNCTIYKVDGIDCSKEYTKYETPQVLVEREELATLQGKTLSVPAATAIDSNGTLISDVICSVVYLADNGKEYDVGVKNGMFITAYSGEYIIRYYATDVFGNEACKEIRVHSYKTYAALEVELSVSKDYQTAKTGDTVYVYEPTANDTYHALGKVDYLVEVTYGNIRVELTNGSFVPMKSGVYTVSYTFTDEAGREAEASYQITVELVEEIVQLSPTPTYLGMVEGNTYTLQDVYVIDYTASEPKKTKADVYVNGEKYTQSTYTPTVSEVEAVDIDEVVKYVTIEYKYANETIPGLSYNLPVRNLYKKVKRQVGMLELEIEMFQIDRYFLVGNGASLKLGTVLEMTTLAKQDAKVRFIQAVPSSNLQLSFDVMRGDENKVKNVKAFHIELTDELDVSKTVKLSFIKEASSTVFYINGIKTVGSFTGSLDGKSQSVFNIQLNNALKNVSDVNLGTAIANVETYTDGRKFNGFSDKVYVAFEVEQEDENQPAEFRLISIHGQNFSNAVVDDTVAPQISVYTSFKSQYMLGEEVETPIAKATDVLSDIAELTVTVTSNGQVVRDKNGVLLEKVSAAQAYVFVMANIGEYRLTYEAKDTRGGVASPRVYVIRVATDQKPVVTLEGKVPTIAKVGQEITLPKMKVDFAVESEENLAYAIYIDPENRYQYLHENKFTATVAGRYYIRYFALDADGNYVMHEYVLQVTK